MKKRLTLVYALSGCVLSFSVVADDGQYPNVGIDFDATIQYDGSRGSDTQTTTDGYLDLTSVVHFRFSPDSEIWLGTEINPVVDVEEGDRRWFSGLGLTVTDLNYYHIGYNHAYRIGKFQVPFGKAMDNAPGLYTEDFVSAYDMSGKIGGYFEYRHFTDSLGIFVPTVSTYFEDTSALSRAYLRPDDQTRRSDGGASNTGNLDSYSIALKWFSPSLMPNLEAEIAFARNHEGELVEPDSPPAGEPAADPDLPDNETMLGIAAQYVFPLDDSARLLPTLSGHYFDLVPFVEYVAIDNEGGVKGLDTNYLTTSLTLNYGRWSYGLTRTQKDIEQGSDDSTEYLNELTAFYQLTGRTSLQFSLGQQKVDGDKSNLIGLAFTYSGAY